jgi:hypothetical protein
MTLTALSGCSYTASNIRRHRLISQVLCVDSQHRRLASLQLYARNKMLALRENPFTDCQKVVFKQMRLSR